LGGWSIEFYTVTLFLEITSPQSPSADELPHLILRRLSSTGIFSFDDAPIEYCYSFLLRANRYFLRAAFRFFPNQDSHLCKLFSSDDPKMIVNFIEQTTFSHPSIFMFLLSILVEHFPVEKENFSTNLFVPSFSAPDFRPIRAINSFQKPFSISDVIVDSIFHKSNFISDSFELFLPILHISQLNQIHLDQFLRIVERRLIHSAYSLDFHFKRGTKFLVSGDSLIDISALILHPSAATSSERFFRIILFQSPRSLFKTFIAIFPLYTLIFVMIESVLGHFAFGITRTVCLSSDMEWITPKMFYESLNSFAMVR
jgi:hypothetical protein